MSPSWSVRDRHGQQLDLFRFVGNVVLLVQTFWLDDPIENPLYANLQAGYELRKEEGFIIILAVDFDGTGLYPDPGGWSAGSPITYAVASDPGLDLTGDPYHDTTSYAVPAVTLLSRSLEVVYVDMFIVDDDIEWGFIDDELLWPAPQYPWPMP